MRATSPLSALPIATAALSFMAAVLVPPAVPSAALAERWQRPVPGEVARSFSYRRATPFAAGAHRGAVLAARPGTVVRAACGGEVIHAGPVGGRDRVVSVRCGRRRVSYLPLSTVSVHAAERVLPGAPIGTVAAGDGGLHLGVRAESDRFGYEDPLPLLADDRRPLPLSGRPTASRRPAPAHRVRLVRPSTAPARRLVRPSAAPARRPVGFTSPASHTAPWPVWAGLALVLAGVAGTGTIAIRRRRLVRRSLRAAGSAA